MRVYVETNFLLELADRQQEHPACERLLSAAETGEIALRVPAVCLTEATASIPQRRKVRRSVLSRLKKEASEILRSDYPDTPALNADILELDDRLIGFVDRDDQALSACRRRLLEAGCVLPVSKRAAALGEELLLSVDEPGYGPMDSLIAGCVFADRKVRPGGDALFVTTDGPFRTHPLIQQQAALAKVVLRGKFTDAARQLLGT